MVILLTNKQIAHTSEHMETAWVPLVPSLTHLTASRALLTHMVLSVQWIWPCAFTLLAFPVARGQPTTPLTAHHPPPPRWRSQGTAGESSPHFELIEYYFFIKV